MANEFQPKELDINSINSGKKWEYGQSPSIETFNEPVEAILYAQEKIKENYKQIETLFAITAQSGLYAMLEKSQAYTTRETAEGENIVDGQYTPVNMITGDTVKSVNLIPFPYSEGVSKTHLGITFKANEDGSVLINGQNTGAGNSTFYLATPLRLSAGQYAFSFDGLSTEVSLMAVINGGYTSIHSTNTVTKTFDTDTDITLYVQVSKDKSNITFTNKVVRPMVNIGSTALPYQPYFAGLKHANFKAIKSTGKNLFNIHAIENLDGCTISEDGVIFAPASAGYLNTTNKKLKELCPSLKAGYKATLSGIWEPPRSEESGKYAGNAVYLRENKRFWKINNAIEITEEDLNSTVMIYAIDDAVTDITISNLQIEYGETATAYEAYRGESIFELSEALELEKWDSLNPQTGELTRQTVRIELDGTESWSTSSTDYSGKVRPYINIEAYGLHAKNERNNGFTVNNMYNDVSYSDTYYAINGISLRDNCLFVYDDNFNTRDISLWQRHLAELSAAGNPLVVEYKKATPTVEKLKNIPKSYKAYRGGSETVIQGETDNSEYGAMPTITQEYFELLGGGK